MWCWYEEMLRNGWSLTGSFLSFSGWSRLGVAVDLWTNFASEMFRFFVVTLRVDTLLQYIQI